jgi:DNA-binding CsgD family transcriptional regulator
VAGAEAAFAEAERLAGRPPPAVALLRLAEGRVPEARRLIDGALAGETWNRLARARLLPARIQIAIAGGDLAAATADAEELDAIAADYGGDVLVAVARTSRGRVHLALGEWPDACRVLREALASWTALDVPYEVATTQLLLGHTCWQLGDEAAAGAALAVAASTFERLGAAVEVPSPDQLRAGASKPAGLDHGLTVREAEVLRLLARGLTNKELSAELRVSPKTIARHIENIFVKIGVSTRSAATAYAYEAGLVASP